MLLTKVLQYRYDKSSELRSTSPKVILRVNNHFHDSAKHSIGKFQKLS